MQPLGAGNFPALNPFPTICSGAVIGQRMPADTKNSLISGDRFI